MFNLSLKCHLYLSTCGRLFMLGVKLDTCGTGPPKAIYRDPQKGLGDGFDVQTPYQERLPLSSTFVYH